MDNQTRLPDFYMQIEETCRAAGGISHRSIPRRIKNNGFPPPQYINGIRFWKYSDVMAWMERQATTITEPQHFAEGRAKGQQSEARAKATETKIAGKDAEDA